MATIEHRNFGWLHAPPFPPACCHCLLIRDGNRVVLVDTGIGTHDIADPVGRIGQEAIDAAGFQFIESVTALSQLRDGGLDADTVTDIVLTHCDPDHVGGLADFPQAVVHVSAEEKVNVEAGNPRYSSSQFSHQPRWAVYDSNDTGLFGLPARTVRTSIDVDIRLVPLFGHTRGHCGVAVRAAGRWTFHAGDAYYLRAELETDGHPVEQLAVLRADDDESRRRSLAALRDLASREGHDLEMCGYHDTGELPDTVPGYPDI